MTNATEISPVISANSSQPTLDQLRLLYKSAQSFGATLPWTFINDSEVFGIVDPETGDMWYCMVRGMETAPCGLIAMNGPKALDVMERQNAPVDPSNLDAILALGDIIPENDYILAAFRSRGDLIDLDIKQINALKLKFHGARDWPVFRSVKNHAADAMVDADETQRLIVFLQQAMDIARRRRNSPELTAVDSDGKMLVRVAKKLKNGTLEWSDNRRAREPIPEPLPVEGGWSSDKLIDEIKKYGKVEKPVEFDFFWSDEMTMKDDGCEYFKRAWALVDAESGSKIIDASFEPLIEGDPLFAVSGLFAFMIEQGKVYANIKVSKPDIAFLLSEVSEQLGITVETADILPSINKYRQTNPVTPLQALSDM
jgi:hypothetical protein